VNANGRANIDLINNKEKINFSNIKNALDLEKYTVGDKIAQVRISPRHFEYYKVAPLRRWFSEEEDKAKRYGRSIKYTTPSSRQPVKKDDIRFFHLIGAEPSNLEALKKNYNSFGGRRYSKKHRSSRKKTRRTRSV